MKNLIKTVPFLILIQSFTGCIAMIAPEFRVQENETIIIIC
ncbi:MAG: hypothetical protein WC061_06525 [Melioribacteraceae bacterium]